MILKEMSGCVTHLEENAMTTPHLYVDFFFSFLLKVNRFQDFIQLSICYDEEKYY